MARYGKVTFTTSYVVDLDDQEMIDEAVEMVAADVREAFLHNEIESFVKIAPDASASEQDISECLLDWRATKNTGKTLSAVLNVDREEVEYCELACRQGGDFCKDEAIFDREVALGDCRFAVRCVASNRPAVDPAWTEGVLFDARGHQVGCTPVGDSFVGEYEIEYGGTLYCVSVRQN